MISMVEDDDEERPNLNAETGKGNDQTRPAASQVVRPPQNEAIELEIVAGSLLILHLLLYYS